MSGKARAYSQECPDWDGVVLHKDLPGVSGYKRWKCRCPPCWKAGLVLRAKARVREQRKREESHVGKDFAHGVTGYRAYGCRCDICSEAGAAFNAAHQGIPRKRWPKVEVPVIEEPPVDWSEVAHLVPGHTIRVRRAA